MKTSVGLLFIVLVAISVSTEASPARARRQTNANVDINSPEFLACFRGCPSTIQYNPICARNGVTYDNQGRLQCANRCGANTQLSFYGACQPL